MDTIIHTSLEEICSQGISGLPLSLLWTRLHAPLSNSGLTLSDSVKRAVLSGLSDVPGIQFTDVNGSVFDPNLKPLDDFEDGLVFGDDQLRRCFVGLYDVKSSHITPPQQRVLERLALARGNGVTQNQLCKEIGMPPNNFFYVVKRLESWGLIVRQSTIVRTKEASSDKSSQPVHTNLIRLHRYAPQLSSQQRLEITKDSNNSEESYGGSAGGAILDECGQDDVLVKDFLPALKAICDRLEQAEGKVLVVSDIKRELGYRETRGHRTWRNVCNRLKQAGLVEIFEATVGSEGESTTQLKKRKSRGPKKPVSCLKLLKKFSPKLFEHGTPDCEYDNLASDQLTSPGKEAQNTDQLVELSLEQQIVDMIDAEGSKGLLGVEVCKRLGISNKMLDHLSNVIVPRFGLHQLSENRNRGSAYRFWTRRNFCPELPSSSFVNFEDGPSPVKLAVISAEEPSQGEHTRITSTLVNDLNSQSWLTGEGAEKDIGDETLNHASRGDKGSSEMVIWDGSLDDVAHNMGITLPLAVNGSESNSVIEVPSSPVPKPFKLQEGQRYPSSTSTKRESWIREKLETEKIIIKPELQHWLKNLEKEKQAKMDNKTLQRYLKNLEKEGHCRIMDFNIPGVSNCGRHRAVRVVVHSSIKGSASELFEQVHDKQRSFETKVRTAVSPVKILKQQFPVPVPVLHGVERIEMNSTSNAGSVKAEAMRANGFVLAKMVRTKLLHCFLWDYANNSARSIDVPASTIHVNSPSNPHSSCLLFSLDNALKAMPLELFLQVVGSDLKWNDMTEKCKNGLLLSDFPDEEYKSLMSTRATSRLSWLIDLLRRLKLIKLVAEESPKEVFKPCTTLVYALELKPYIEEPPSVDSLPGYFGSVDLRPHFRHDFVLSTTEGLEKYWQTLEYCYAAADPKAAAHAFPGSVADEVCLYKSWTRVRVMKAAQRAELLKRIKDQRSKKLTFKECREIARELNLTLDQVLRFYYDNRQRRLDRFQSDPNAQAVGSNTRNDIPRSQRKRKRSSKGRSAKDKMVDYPTESLDVGEDEQEQDSSVGQSTIPKLKEVRKSKFSWTEEANRQLIVLYARKRAIQGARSGFDWPSISDLPTDPTTCRKRLAYYMNSEEFRKPLMRLCNLLTQRYARHLDRESMLALDDNSENLNSTTERWDDFEDSNIETTLDEVLMQMMKFDSAKRAGSASQQSQGPPKPIAVCSGLDNDGEKQQISSYRKSRRNLLSQKFVKDLKEGVCVVGRINQSLATSSAVELFKLVFLTNSLSADMPNLLAETLRCYSEHDVYSAFDYLKQKKILIGSPFVLSQSFLKSLSWSQFPTNAWKRAARLASCMHDKEEKLMEGLVNLPSDLQCGDIFQLFALVSSGELSISPVLPREGVGEAEDSRNSKRKSTDNEYDNYSMNKKHKHQASHESELYSRREKGFPGINVSLSRRTITRTNVVEFFKDDENLLSSENDNFYATLGQKSSSIKSFTYNVEEAPDFGNPTPATVISGDSVWQVMANYTIRNWSDDFVQENVFVHPELFKTAYRSIQKAGDQGLSMSKVSECIDIHATILSEHIVDVLELFGFVLKVNGYDYVHVVDGLYRAKYFLTSKATSSRDPEGTTYSTSQMVDDSTNVVKEAIDHEHELLVLNADEVHKVTVLNLSEDNSELSNEIQAHDDLEGSSQTNTKSNKDSKKNQNFEVVTCFQPILPWINGDGTINVNVYRGLTRRVLGIVAHKPGILEDGILRQMDVLNPQSCRRLLELMVLDKHLSIRKLCQRTSSATPPALLEGLFGNNLKKPKYACREHYFANPMSIGLL